MRILLITETVPFPLDSGGRIKTYHTLTALARAHDVHCHAFVRTEAQREATDAPVRALCRTLTLHLVPRSRRRELIYLLRSFAGQGPYTVVRHFDAAACEAIRLTCAREEIDLVYCDHLSMFAYAHRLGVPIVYDAHNVEHRIVARQAAETAPGPRRWLLRREARLLRAYEAAACLGSALVLAVSEVDARALAELSGPRARVTALPIAVDTASLGSPGEEPDQPGVLFVGGLDWPPNADAVEFFLRDVWPRVRRAVPAASFTVVGGGGRALRARWGAVDGVTFTGRVDDLAPWFAASRVIVVPILAGSGMRVKILDAFARGRPVVATSVGAEGIAAEGGTHLLLADDAGGFAEATVRLLTDRTRARELASRARRLVEEQYDVAVVGERLLRLVEGLSRSLPESP